MEYLGVQIILCLVVKTHVLVKFAQYFRRCAHHSFHSIACIFSLRDGICFLGVWQARQVREVFPHMPTAAIVDDLRLTRSVEMTIENILVGRLAVPPVSMPRVGVITSLLLT